MPWRIQWVALLHVALPNDRVAAAAAFVGAGASDVASASACAGAAAVAGADDAGTSLHCSVRVRSLRRGLHGGRGKPLHVLLARRKLGADADP